MTWSAETYIAKARCYVERGLEATDDSLRAWWFHFAVEPLLRAVVSKVHPALLADSRSVDSLLAAVGADLTPDAVVRSRPINEVLELAVRLRSFQTEVKEAAARLLLRRNVECHGPEAAFPGVPEDAWMPDFLMVAAACCSAADVDLAGLVGEGYTTHARELAASARADVERVVTALIAAARRREAVDVPATGWTMAERVDGNVIWVVTCPACGGQGQMSGSRVHVGSPRFDGDELSQPVTVAGRRFSCARCGLELKGRAQLSAAGLPATVRTSDHLDPYEVLNIDLAEEAEARGLHVVDPADFEYQDE
jgi:hypothetical protein